MQVPSDDLAFIHKAMYAFIPGEAVDVNPPVRDYSITIVESTDDSDNADDDPLGSNPAGGHGDDDYKDDDNDGGNDAYDDEASNDGFDNNNSGDCKEDASMEEAEGCVENSESSAGSSANPTINAASTTTYFYSIKDVPPLNQCIIKEPMGLYWDIDSPRDFQVVPIDQGTFDDDTIMYLISRTVSDKSALPITIDMLRRGVTVVIVTLLGLGSDQVKNQPDSRRASNRITSTSTVARMSDFFALG